MVLLRICLNCEAAILACEEPARSKVEGILRASDLNPHGDAGSTRGSFMTESQDELELVIFSEPAVPERADVSNFSCLLSSVLNPADLRVRRYR